MGCELTDKRCEEIKWAVTNLFRHYGVCTLPVDVSTLVEKMGIKLKKYSNLPESSREIMLKESLDGFSVETDNGKLCIAYNDQQIEGRKRYTIMHEIGHIVLGHMGESELAEKEANFFAKYALVPPPLIHELGLDNPEDISDIFEISYEAAEYAYSYYGKWLRFGSSEYTDYECILLDLFKMEQRKKVV